MGFQASEEIVMYPYDVKTEGEMVVMKLGVENHHRMLFGLNKTVLVTPWPFKVTRLSYVLLLIFAVLMWLKIMNYKPIETWFSF